MAAEYTLEVNQGASKVIQAAYKDSLDQPIDLTGYQGRGSIKLKMSDANPVAVLDVTVTDAAGGLVEVALAADALDGLQLKGKAFDEKSAAVYDVELYTSGDADVIRLLNGTCNISPEVTK